MYTLLLVLTIYGANKASISTTQIDFATKALCEQAQSEVRSQVSSYYDMKTVLCLKTK